MRGNELVGPCPCCGGEDRFRVMPDGSNFCRQCHPDYKTEEHQRNSREAIRLTFGDDAAPEPKRRRAQVASNNRPSTNNEPSPSEQPPPIADEEAERYASEQDDFDSMPDVGDADMMASNNVHSTQPAGGYNPEVDAFVARESMKKRLPVPRAGSQAYNNLERQYHEAQGAPKPVPAEPKTFTPPKHFAGRWDYKRRGNTFGSVWRVDKEGTDQHGKRKKDMFPATWDGQRYVTGHKGKWPIYRYDEVRASNNPVLIVEGEKAADYAASALNGQYSVTTWQGGTPRVMAADWKTIYGRDVYLWPDNDTPGAEAMDKLEPRFLHNGSKVFRITPAPGQVPAADACDIDQERIAAYIQENATEIQPPYSGDEVDVTYGGTKDMLDTTTWLWDDWIERNHFCLIGGAPEAGKSTVAWWLMGCFTRGETPDGKKLDRPLRCLYWTSEESDHRLAGMSIAHNVDDSMLATVAQTRTSDGKIRPFDPKRDLMPLVRGHLAGNTPKPDVIVLDPIVSAVMGKTNSADDVRGQLEPIIKEATRLGITIIGLTHFAKASMDRTPLERILGSIQFGAMARTALVVAQFKDFRLLGKAKASHAIDGKKGIVVFRTVNTHVENNDTGKEDWVGKFTRISEDTETDFESEQKRILKEEEDADKDEEGSTGEVLRALPTDSSFITREQLLEKTTCDPSTVNRAVRKLKERGKVIVRKPTPEEREQMGIAPKVRAALYALPENIEASGEPSNPF